MGKLKHRKRDGPLAQRGKSLGAGREEGGANIENDDEETG